MRSEQKKMKTVLIKTIGEYTIRKLDDNWFGIFNGQAGLIQEYTKEKDAIKGLEKITNIKQDEVSDNK